MQYNTLISLDKFIRNELQVDAKRYEQLSISIKANRMMISAFGATVNAMSGVTISQEEADNSVFPERHLSASLRKALDMNFIEASIVSSELMLNCHTTPAELEEFTDKSSDIKQKYTTLFKNTRVTLSPDGQVNPSQELEHALISEFLSMVERLHIYPNVVSHPAYIKLRDVVQSKEEPPTGGCLCSSPSVIRHNLAGDISCCDDCGEIILEIDYDDNYLGGTKARTTIITTRTKNGREYFEAELNHIAGIQDDNLDEYISDFYERMRQRSMRSDAICLRDVYNFLTETHPSKKKHAHKIYYIVSTADNTFISSNIQRLVNMYNIYIQAKMEMSCTSNKKQDYNNIKFLIFSFLRIMGVPCSKADIFPKVQTDLSDQYTKLRPIAERIGWDMKRVHNIKSNRSLSA